MDDMLAATCASWVRRCAGKFAGRALTAADHLAIHIGETISPLNCAATLLQDPEFTTPCVAMNSWLSTGVESALRLAKLPSGIDYRRIDGHGESYHAEQKILDNYMPGWKPFYIGISKPCCLKCAVALSLAGVGFRSASLDVWPWRLPEYIRRDPELKRQFVADDQAEFTTQAGRTLKLLDVYNSFDTEKQGLYVRRLETLDKFYETPRR